MEVFHGPVLDHSPVVTPYGARFVTGAQGLGHVVLPVTDPEGAFTFYTEVLGFRPRGAFRIPAPPEFGPMRVRFLGINERHHSLALCPAPHGGAPGLVHVMVEVDSLDAVGQALDRVLKDDYSLSSTLGRHTNDKMVSFLCTGTRRMGYRVRDRRHARRRNVLHRRRNHRRQLLGTRLVR